MTFWGILTLLTGAAGIVLGGMMFGDIGLAAIIAGCVGLFSGLGLLVAAGKIKKLNKQ